MTSPRDILAVAMRLPIRAAQFNPHMATSNCARSTRNLLAPLRVATPTHAPLFASRHLRKSLERTPMNKLLAALVSFAFAGTVLAQNSPAPAQAPTDTPKAEAPTDKAPAKTTAKKATKKKGTSGKAKSKAAPKTDAAPKADEKKS